MKPNCFFPASYEVIEIASQEVKNFWPVPTSRLQSLTSVLIWFTTHCISCNSHDYRFLYDQFKLNVDNFTVKTWTNSFKFELLSVILLHTMLEFDLLFSFTKENWTFESFQLTVYEILRGGKFKLSTKSSPKNKQSMNWKMVRIFSERNR